MQSRFRNLTASLARTAIVLALAAGFVAPATAETPLQPHTAEYKVKISVLGGMLNTELRTTESGYVAKHVVRPTGMSKILARGHISDTAEFDRGNGGVLPIRFQTEDSVSRDQTNANIRFDWNSGEARGTVNDQEFSSTMEDLAFDRVSIQYELMHDLLNDAYSDEYILFDVDELKTVKVTMIGSRNVKVPAGRYTAIGVRHQAVGSKRITTMWCVEELGFLPVIIEQHRKGKLRMRATLKEYSPLPG